MQRFLAILGLLFLFPLATLSGQTQDAATPDATAAPIWSSVGQGLTNLRYQPAENRITTANVGTLFVKWAFTTSGDVTATPTVVDGVVYFHDTAGNLYAVNAATGTGIWTHTITSYTGVADAYARGSPAVANGALFLGSSYTVGVAHNGAHVFSAKTSDGSLLWNTIVDTHEAAIITGSPIVYNNIVYVGVSSFEEAFARSSGYGCCTFRGSLVALNATTGKVIWQTYMTPANSGEPNLYSGAAIWSPPAIDVSRNQVYVMTGNNYSAPLTVEACEAANVANKTSKICTASNDYFDSLVAMNLTTGAVVWANRVTAYDVFNLACHLVPPGPNCPDPTGDDYDFGGGGPNVLTGLVGAGRKSGYYNTFNPANNGNFGWKTQVGPPGALGGILWGTASDGTRVFTATGNSSKTPWKLVSGETVTWGFWTGMDAKTGKILWQTPEPTSGTVAISSISTANGVMYVGSDDATGHMYALDSSTGKILWSFASGGSVQDAPAIVNGVVYWGSGDKRYNTANNKLYAFHLP